MVENTFTSIDEMVQELGVKQFGWNWIGHLRLFFAFFLTRFVAFYTPNIYIYIYIYIYLSLSLSLSLSRTLSRPLPLSHMLIATATVKLWPDP